MALLLAFFDVLPPRELLALFFDPLELLVVFFELLPLLAVFFELRPLLEELLADFLVPPPRLLLR